MAATLDTSYIPDYTSCVTLLTKMMEALFEHAPHHVSPLITCHVPFTAETYSDSMRVAAVSVLSSAAEHKCGGDKAQYTCLHAMLLKCAHDNMALVRRLALKGLASLVLDMGEDDLKTAVNCLVSGIDDDTCSSVSLTALRGLVKLLPRLEPDHLQSLLASLALKAGSNK